MINKIVSLVFLAVVALAFGRCDLSAQSVKLHLISDQLSHPTAFTVTKKYPNLLFVCEQEGRIRVIENGKLIETPFLDITKEVLKKEGYDERGLLGLAFHPDYASNGKFYLYCSVRLDSAVNGVDHQSEIREYRVTKNSPRLASPLQMRRVLVFNQPQSNHNGGDLKFGADGFLYISAGDGGGGGDKHRSYGNAQNLTNLLGKILRIDVDEISYSIPASNPFIKTQQARPEVYAYGLRNPWRFSFDRQTNKLFAGDVGQNKFEEIDSIESGRNYGWRAFEGLHDFRPEDSRPTNPIAPITEYPHTEGISITGGFVYRGKAIPASMGKYIFADYMGPVWQLTLEADNTWTRKEMSISREVGYWQVYSFGEDLTGELYVLTVLMDNSKGALYKLIPQ